MIWLRKRAPYIVLVIAIAIGAGYLQSDIRRTDNTATKLHAAVAKLDAQQDQLVTQQKQLEKNEQEFKNIRKTNTYETCLHFNRVQDNIVHVVETSRQRSLVNLKAVLAAPTTTQEQKLAALKNYAGLVVAKNQLRSSLKDEICVRALNAS